MRMHMQQACWTHSKKLFACTDVFVAYTLCKYSGWCTNDSLSTDNNYKREPKNRCFTENIHQHELTWLSLISIHNQFPFSSCSFLTCLQFFRSYYLINFTGNWQQVMLISPLRSLQELKKKEKTGQFFSGGLISDRSLSVSVLFSW